jgi:hypothetical protein
LAAKMAPLSLMCIEVPYCSLQSDFQNRIYDSPHLTFWNHNSLQVLFERLGFSIYKNYQYGRPYSLFFSEHAETLSRRDLVGSSLRYVFPLAFLKKLIPRRLRMSVNLFFNRECYSPVRDAAFCFSHPSAVSLNCIRILGFKE